MNNKKCTSGLRRIAMLAAVALMMALATGCGDDECDDGEQLIELDGDNVCLSICDSDDDCADDEECQEASPNDVCVPDDDNGGDPECEDNDDCSGDDVCEGGECVPPDEPECEDNDDCSGDDVCEGGECVPPDEPDCENNDDCPGDDVCEGGECVAGPECENDEDCGSGLQCHEQSCVECVDNADCPTGEECTADNVCHDPTDLSNDEWCEAYCETQLGCIEDVCSIPNPAAIPDAIDSCLNDTFLSDGDGGCYAVVDDALAQELEEIMHTDPNTGEEQDEMITCDQMHPQYCGPFGLGEFCACTPPTTIGDSCDANDECDDGDLPVGECLDFEADIGLDECDPADPQCEGDEECWTLDADSDFHVCAEACESNDDCDEEAGEACFLVEEGSNDAICAPDPDADVEPDIEDGQCIAGPCSMLHGDAEVGAGYVEEYGCGPDANCIANPGQTGTVGICQVTCEPGSCEGDWVCQTTGPLYDQDPPTMDDPSPPIEIVGASQTCMPECEEDTDCAPDGARCSSEGICEFSCDDVTVSLMCDEAGGTCEEDDDGDEYCVL